MRPQELCFGTKTFFVATLVITLLSGRSAGVAHEKVLHNFVDLPHGATPQANLIADTSGNLYGTTASGGRYGYGAVFKLTSSPAGKWKQTVLYSFQGSPSDGSSPSGGLIFDAAGNLYGVTAEGGNNSDQCIYYGCGIVFRLSSTQDGTWEEKVLHSFTWS